MRFLCESLLFILSSCLTVAVLGYEGDDGFLPDKPPDRHPVLLFPGLGASQLEARINKTTSPHFFCRKQRDWYRLWLDPAAMLPKFIDCFFDNMRIVWNDTTNQPQNAPGVETRVAGFGSTSEIEFLSQQLGHTRFHATGYFYALVEGLVTLGYERDKSIRGAPYDFRLAPNQAPEYFDQTRNLIQQMYAENGDHPVILIGHSMGCLYSYYLLLHQPQEWKDKYIHSWVTIAAPFAGSTQSFRSVVMGDNLHIPIFSPMTFQPLQRTLPGVYSLMPDPEKFSDMVIMAMEGRDYTTDDYDELFDVIANPVGKKMWNATRGLFKGYPFPGVTTHCLKGKNVPTPESMNFPNANSFPLKSELKYGDGDGTVNTVSADVCMEWANQLNFYSQDMSGIPHAALVRHPDTVAYVVKLVLEANFMIAS